MPSATQMPAARAQAAASPISDNPPQEPPPQPPASPPASPSGETQQGRRAAKRRPAGPARAAIAANDDIPTIGGLIYALEQKPSHQPFKIASICSAIWAGMSVSFGGVVLYEQVTRAGSWSELLAQPTILVLAATIGLPIAIFYFLAMLIWRAQELKLMSSAMTEVAVRLAEPDRHAEQTVASLGQVVRKQVGFMNEAVAQAINRASELEAMVHSEVSNLERSFQDNEQRIRKVLGELASERTQLVSTSSDVHATLRAMGDEVPALIEKLNGQQGKLARIIESAGQNLIALEGSLLTASDKLEGSLNVATDRIEVALNDRTSHLQRVLDEYTGAMNASLGNRAGQMQTLLQDFSQSIDSTLGSRTGEMQTYLDSFSTALDSTLGQRTGQMQSLFDDFSRALDASLGERTLGLETTLIERTRALDSAFAERISSAMNEHARQLAETLTRQSRDIDENLMHGIDAVRRSSENITRQSVKAIEGLSGQADMLRNVSENLLTQIGSVTSRFENQGQSIMRAANALETANFRIDNTLQQRHRELNDTLEKLTGKATEFDSSMRGYSSSVEEQMQAAERRAREAISGLDQVRSDAENRATRALTDMQTHVGNVGRDVTTQIGSLSTRISETSDELRSKTQRAAAELLAENERLRAEADRLPSATRESADAMRRVLQDQIQALDRLSTLSNRQAMRREVTPPAPAALAPPPPASAPPQPQHYAAPAQPAYNQYAPPTPPVQQPAAPQPSAPQNRWSLGELLSRASDDQQHARPQPQSYSPAPPPANPAGANPINLEVIASALDQDTAAALWSRYRAGQRGIMVRSIYSAEGRTTFDEVSRRYGTDPTFRSTVDTFLKDFEQLLRESDHRDPSGRMTETHLLSTSGRTYLFLAHASGRIG